MIVFTISLILTVCGCTRLNDSQQPEHSTLSADTDTVTNAASQPPDTGASREKVRVVVRYTGKRTKVYYKDIVDSTVREH